MWRDLDLAVREARILGLDPREAYEGQFLNNLVVCRQVEETLPPDEPRLVTTILGVRGDRTTTPVDSEDRRFAGAAFEAAWDIYNDLRGRAERGERLPVTVHGTRPALSSPYQFLGFEDVRPTSQDNFVDALLDKLGTTDEGRPERVVAAFKAITQVPKILPRVPLNNDEVKCTCNVAVEVGAKTFRCLMDTGAGRSLIRTDFANMLLKSMETKDSCLPPTPLGRPLNCEGAEKGRVIGRIDTYIVVRITFQEPEEAEEPEASGSGGNAAFRDLRSKRWGRGKHSVDIKFYMMDNLSDPMILGYPELSTLGCYAEPPDMNGRRWIQLTQAGPGLRLPILAPERRSTANITMVRNVHIEGPNTHMAYFTLTGAEYGKAVE